jgi:hypothetical protein
VILIPVAGGPDWTDIMTAFGTVGAVIAAVGIALWTEWRSARRLAAEQARSDRQLEEERARSRAEIEEERRIAREREQLAEAYQVQVVNAEEVQLLRDPTIEELGSGKVDNPYAVRVDLTHLAVLIVNHGSYTITRVEVQFCPDGRSLIPPIWGVRVLGFAELPKRLRGDRNLEPGSDTAIHDTLTPWDTGVRFVADPIETRTLERPYSLVRWTDRWGAWWEHRRGEVRQVGDDEPSVP